MGEVMEKTREDIINEKRSTTIDNPKFNIVWEGQPSGFLGNILTSLHINFTWYKISKDELIIQKGFFSRHTDTIELYLLKDPDLKETLWQRMFNVGTVSVRIDDTSRNGRAGEIIELKNIKKCEEVRKLLRDYIEADVVERGITYFDRV
jgi:hypothetical protein